MQKSNSGRENLITFLFSKTFAYHLIAAIVVLILLLLLLFKFISIYTDHGEELVVPSFHGSTVEELKSAGYHEKFDFFIVDSLYDEYYKSGAIMIQDPAAG